MVRASILITYTARLHRPMKSICLFSVRKILSWQRSSLFEDRCQRTDVRCQRAEDRCQRTDDRGQNSELFECGSRTRRRPIGRDYAAAKDAEVGKTELKAIL